MTDNLREHPASHVLDHAVWESLTGAHRHLSEGDDTVRRYRPEVSPIAAARDLSDPATWDALAGLVGPGQEVPLAGGVAELPAGWTELFSAEGVQMVATDALVSRHDADAVALGKDDVPEMLDLVERTKPGPFAPETYRLGTYLGIRENGRLVAMAGERMHPPGWTEISAVCTDEEFRGRGLATRLVRAVAAGIRDRGETPFLHAAATNVNAIALYERLGFVVRHRTTFVVARTPDHARAPHPVTG